MAHGTQSAMTLDALDDNSSENADRLAAWAKAFAGVSACVVFDYIKFEEGPSLPGAVNGVTIQWDDTDELVDEVVEVTPEGEDDIVTPVIHRVSQESVHVRPGQTVTRVRGGFAVAGEAVAR
jgi:hypothetical protein